VTTCWLGFLERTSLIRMTTPRFGTGFG
jgi:hypothetical protein